MDEVLAASMPIPGAPGSGATGGGLVVDPAVVAEAFERWEFWFEWNKDVLLRSRTARRAEVPSSPAESPRVDAAYARREIAPYLREALAVAEPHLLRTTLLSLGKAGDPGLVEPLRAALDGGSPETRRIAALALGLSGDRGALARLASVFDDPGSPPDLRAAAAVGLGLQGRPEASTLLRGFLEKHLNPESAGGGSRDLVISALLAAGMVRDASVVPLLVGRYRALLEERPSRSRVVLAVLLHTLGRLGDASALNTLLEALGERDVEIRRAAALALGDLGASSAVGPLAAILASDSDLQTRGFAAVSLGRLGGSAATSALRAAYAAKGVSRTVRSFSALGLGLAGDRASAPELRRALAGPGEEDLRGAFAIALGFLRDAEAVETLFSIVERRGADPDLRGYAAIALGLIRPDGGLPRLLRAYREDSEKIEDYRRGLLLGLGLFGDTAATAAVVETLSIERRDGVRGAAVQALNLLRDRAAAKTVADLLFAPHAPGAPPDRAAFSSAALGALGDAHVYPLISESFFNGNYRLRISLLEELADLL